MLNRNVKKAIWLREASLSLFLLLGATVPLGAAAAAAPGATAGVGGSTPDPKVQQLLRDADSALKTGNLNLALIELKNAVQLAPTEGEPRARLGLALLRQRAAVAAERELRQARRDKAPDELVVPGILQAMLMRGEAKELLAEFSDPPQAAQDRVAAETLNSRAIALEILGEPVAASAAMDRALRLRRDISFLLTRAKMAGLQNDPVLARQLLDEALKTAPDNAEALALSVSLLRQRGEAQKALAEADDFLKRNSTNIPARAARIEVLLALKDEVRAQQDIDAIVRQAPRSATGFYYRAVLAARHSDFKGAWQIAQGFSPAFVQSQPNIATEVAQIAIASGNADTGAAILAALISRHPEVQQARLQLAAVQLREKHPEAALSTLETLKASDAPGVQATLAQAYLQLRRYADATLSLQKATASPAAGTNEFLKQQLAASEFATGNVDKGIEILQALAARDPGNAAIAGQLSVALMRDGKLDDAIAAADRLAKAQPKSPLPSFYRGIILGAQGKLAAASSALDQSLAADPKFLPALFYRSDISVARGNPERASKDLQQILAQDPASFVAYMRLAQIALNDGRDADVTARLHKAVDVAPKNPVPRLALANYQNSRAKYQDAQATIDGLLQVSPNNPDALALRGQIQMATGDQKNAIATFRALAATNPRLPGVQALLANALNAIKDNTGAEAAIRKAIELAPDAAQLRTVLIGFEVAAGKPDAALATAGEYGSAYPGPAADLLMADTLMRLKRMNDADALLAKAYAAKPDGALAMGSARTAMVLGDPKKALARLLEWLQKNPRDFVVRQEYASLLLQTGDRTGARREFEALLKERPEDPVALDGVGWIIQKDDSARALSLASLAAKIAPRSPEIMDTLGWIKFQRQDTQGALPLLKRAHDLKSDDPEIGYHLALALDATGKRAEAKTLLQSALAKNVKFDDAQNAQQLVTRW